MQVAVNELRVVDTARLFPIYCEWFVTNLCHEYHQGVIFPLFKIQCKNDVPLFKFNGFISD